LDHAVIAISSRRPFGLLRTTLHSRAVYRWRGFFGDHKCGIAAVKSGAMVGPNVRLLFHDTKLRMPPLGGPAVGAALLLCAHDLVAQEFQLGIADLIELHAQIENRDRHQLGGLVAAALAKHPAALLEHFKNGKQMFF
jgi:hypothetical protein